MRIINNNKGFSLIEIVAGLPLVALVFTLFAIGILHFVTTFQEVKLYAQLQKDLFDAVEMMRHGYMYEGVTDDEGLIGLTTAKEVEIGTSKNSIKVTPLVLNLSLQDNYWVTYTVNNKNQLEINGLYGFNIFPERKTIFPSTPTKYIGTEPQFKIKNPRQVWTITHYDTKGNPLMVDIKLVGQVRFREKIPKQSNEDDIRNNTRTITYETSVFLGNSHANVEDE